MKPAVFLDRDGTLNVEKHYLYRIEDFEWIPGAQDAVKRLKNAGFLVIVITNQAGIARGYYSEEDVRELHAFMENELKALDTSIDAYYYCPYHPDGVVDTYTRVHPCRKPAPGMIREAMKAFEIDADKSFVVGDRNSDIEAGLAMGMQTILVETGYGLEQREATRAHHVAPHLGVAADLILAMRS